MSLSALLLCLLAVVWGATQPSTLRGLSLDLDGHGRVVGGEPVDISQFPWQVSLEEFEYGKHRHFCGGSVIGSTWVLTAASCLSVFTADELYVRAGTSFRASGGRVYRVATIIRHNYDRGRDYDFALLEISEPISFGSNVQAVLLGISEIAAGTEVTATGWGFTEGVGKPEQLHAVTTCIVDRDACRAAYAALRQNITRRMICAGGGDGGRGPCSEDGGGPLVAGNTQYGVVSFGVGCAMPGYPSVYSNVPAVRSWITEKTGI